MVSRAWSNLLATMLVVACSSRSEPGAPPPAPSVSSDPPATAGTSGPQSQVEPARDGGAAACEPLGALAGQGLEATLQGDTRWIIGNVTGRSVPTRLMVLGAGSPSALQGVTAQLGGGANANYATCTHCVLLFVGCSATDCLAATKYFATTGDALFGSAAASPGDAFTGRVRSATLAEVTIDPQTQLSSLVPNGKCFRLDSFTFTSTAGGLDGGATDAGADGGAGGLGGGGRGMGSGGYGHPGPLIDRPPLPVDGGDMPDAQGDGGEMSVCGYAGDFCPTRQDCCPGLICDQATFTCTP